MVVNSTAGARRSREQVYCEDQDMDEDVSWISGRQIYAGRDVAECFTVAADMVDGAAATWQRAWLVAAARVEAQAT
jgi:hypothetical protein